MSTIESLARAAMDREALSLRGLAQDLLHEQPDARTWQRPATSDPQLQAIAAGLAELLAARLGQDPPPWTAQVGPAPQAFYLVKAAETMVRTRTLCFQDSPAPLRRRRLYAPPNFLEFA